jgi:hypothetical protein
MTTITETPALLDMVQFLDARINKMVPCYDIYIKTLSPHDATTHSRGVYHQNKQRIETARDAKASNKTDQDIYDKNLDRLMTNLDIAQGVIDDRLKILSDNEMKIIDANLALTLARLAKAEAKADTEAETKAEAKALSLAFALAEAEAKAKAKAKAKSVKMPAEDATKALKIIAQIKTEMEKVVECKTKSNPKTEADIKAKKEYINIIAEISADLNKISKLVEARAEAKTEADARDELEAGYDKIDTIFHDTATKAEAIITKAEVDHDRSRDKIESDYDRTMAAVYARVKADAKRKAEAKRKAKARKCCRSTAFGFDSIACIVTIIAAAAIAFIIGQHPTTSSFVNDTVTSVHGSVKKFTTTLGKVESRSSHAIEELGRIPHQSIYNWNDLIRDEAKEIIAFIESNTCASLVDDKAIINANKPITSTLPYYLKHTHAHSGTNDVVLFASYVSFAHGCHVHYGSMLTNHKGRGHTCERGGLSRRYQCLSMQHGWSRDVVYPYDQVIEFVWQGVTRRNFLNITTRVK